ncbi:hypothetical protein GCM10009677_31540 [Sphaerisporangium rubeum]|uniref:Putative nucleotide-binding protein n=1 Tax=Sphaerisporangium rubeum TaxID=321317 RepID=A0A7X0IC25_9ACTN|nr:CATRA conflict system CASPASE/TPR repeat-associated protein [Sphaerisporangium rubeum]MBB6472454.1 putative nucleotide-binding protein [Sphaerisporangium rubeum]
MTGLSEVNHQFVTHLYAPGSGPDAGPAYRALRDIWSGCRQVFQMVDPVPGLRLRHLLPDSYDDLPPVTWSGPEAALAVQEQTGARCQAVLRRHHNILNLSVALAPTPLMPSPDGPRSWWRELDRQWTRLTATQAPHLLGEARLYLADLAAPPPDHTMTGRELGPLVPGDQAENWWRRGVTHEERTTIWETSPSDDGQWLRRFLVAFATADAKAASAWTWSHGSPTIPPLARYLLHAAVMRFHLRVWQRDDRTAESRDAIDALLADLRRRRATARGGGRPLDLSRLGLYDASLICADLRELRESVTISVHNMSRVVGTPQLLAAGPFADDRAMARSFIARLDDQIAYLEIAAHRTDRLEALSRASELAARPFPEPEATMDASPDVTRRVFVVHGRDEEARTAMFDFLRSLDLEPLEWEPLVSLTGSTLPYLGDVVSQAVSRAQATVVLMTPDDVVSLHPSLHGTHEDSKEIGPSMQARPNVLLELGMALAIYRDRTIIVTAGDHRPITDLGGMNYIRLTDSAQCHNKIATRLQIAGCQIKNNGHDWLRPRFQALASYRREPPVT